MKGQGRKLTFGQLAVHDKFLTAYNGYCTIDGVACTQIGNDREVFIDSKGKISDYIRPKQTDGRIEANKKRIGEKLERNGKFVRSTEVRRTIIAWVAAIGGIHKVKFTTVTFPEGTPDKVGSTLLNILLTRWRKATPDLSYLWTAERQKNGTLHYHLVHDLYINIELLNGFMRAAIKNKVDQIPNYTKADAERYNGVHIAPKLYSSTGIEKYLAKYLTKAQKSGINQPWHRSREMGNLATKVRFSMDRIRSFMSLALSYSDPENDLINVFENDYCLFIAWPPQLSSHVKWHLDKLNRSRWRGLKQATKSPSRVQPVAVPRELQLDVIKKGTGSQIDMLDLFPVTNYQTRGKQVR